MKKINALSFVALAALATTLLTNCVTNAPKARFTQSLAAADQITSVDKVSSTVSGTSDSKLMPNDATRLAQKIEEQIRTAAKPGSGSGRPVEVRVAITRSDKGNALARAVLAGLGQIHIDGQVTVLSGGRKVSEFTLKKTFAFGGIYGASVTIVDCETGYAKGVAEAVTGTKLK